MWRAAEHYGPFIQETTDHAKAHEGKLEGKFKWQDDHCERFRLRGLAWPVDFDAVANEADLTFIRGSLSDRAAESLFYMHKSFPHTDKSEPEFGDVNVSLPRLVPDEEKSPWKQMCPTMVGSAHMCVRYVNSTSGNIAVRPITPIEAFELIGWAECDLHLPVPIRGSTAINMAGNAFSAFAVVPALVLLFTGLC